MREIAAKLCRRLSRYVRARVLYLPTRKRGSRRCGGGDDTVMSNKEGAEGKPHPGNERPTNLRRRGYRSRVSGRGAVAEALSARLASAGSAAAVDGDLLLVKSARELFIPVDANLHECAAGEVGP